MVKVEEIKFNIEENKKQTLKYNKNFNKGFFAGAFGTGLIMSVLGLHIDNPKYLMGVTFVSYGILWFIGEQIYNFYNKRKLKNIGK